MLAELDTNYSVCRVYKRIALSVNLKYRRGQTTVNWYNNTQTDLRLSVLETCRSEKVVPELPRDGGREPVTRRIVEGKRAIVRLPPWSSSWLNLLSCNMQSVTAIEQLSLSL